LIAVSRKPVRLVVNGVPIDGTSPPVSSKVVAVPAGLKTRISAPAP
jgi:hypothetical protein